MANQINEVLQGLFIGNYDDVKDFRQMRNYNISHIVCLMEKPKHDLADRYYLCIQESDTRNAHISEYISVVNDFIHEARRNEKNVLVHCLHGVSLSTAMIVAYIMTVTKFNWFNALNVIRAERSFALPLPGLLAQLEEFQRDRLYVERCRLEFKYPPNQIYLIDLEWCYKSLRYFEMMAETNPNLFDKIPNFEFPIPESDASEEPSTSKGVRKIRKSLVADTFPLKAKPKVEGGGVLLMENVLLFEPINQKDLGTKGKFVDPIDHVKRRHRHFHH